MNTKETMKWYNLPKNKCPKCNGDFVKGLVTVSGVLIHEPCGFKIREIRYKQIINDIVTKRLTDEQINEQEGGDEHD